MKIAKRQFMTEERLRSGYVIVLPGIEGYSFLNRRIVKGLIQGGLPHAVEIHDWTCRWRIGLPMFLYNLRSRRLHDQEGAVIVDKIRRYQQDYPNRPVFLIGHSGGGGMTMVTLEQLPPEHTIDGAILLGGAISPTYDARKGLRRVTRGVWNLYSCGDFLFLGLMTIFAGTFDGRHSCCSGMLGFRSRDQTGAPDPKLFSIPFRREFLRFGNWGGHFGYTSPRFVQQFLLPLITTTNSSTSAPELSTQHAFR